jgi:hypothetical protein
MLMLLMLMLLMILMFFMSASLHWHNSTLIIAIGYLIFCIPTQRRKDENKYNYEIVDEEYYWK